MRDFALQVGKAYRIYAKHEKGGDPDSMTRSELELVLNVILDDALAEASVGDEDAVKLRNMKASCQPCGCFFS